LNDKRANRLQLNSYAKIVKVSSLYNNNHIAIKLKWRDVNRSISTTKESDRYDDAFAIEIPIEHKNPKKLPYIGMGSKDRAVEIYYGSTVDKRDRAFIAEGFRDIKNPIDKNDFNISITYDNNSSWIATLSRPIKDDYIDLNKSSIFPLAFAIWRGDRLNRAELKLISSWTPLKFKQKDINKTIISELIYNPKESSIKIGRDIAKAKCSSCHIFEHNSTTKRYIAPNLSNIGGYSTKAYIMESINDPDAVIVDGYSPKAYPKFSWYNIDENGTQYSNMPSIELDTNSTKHLIRYLMSLKSKVER
jgi:complex iron-sulfur molybdoenzyme family reductase subunit gamma